VGNRLYGLKLILPLDLQEIVEGFLANLVPWGWEESKDKNQVQIKIIFNQPELAQQTAHFFQAKFESIQTEFFTLSDQNWLQAWKKFFTPIPVENTFLILPSWDKTNPEPYLPIYIHPQMAFGTGHHSTTYLCLSFIAELKPNPSIYFLDLGTGSGILGIACAKLGMRGIGLDIDPTALDNARLNVRLNKVEHLFSVKSGTIKRVETKFDLILANILATPLIKMAPFIVQALNPQGILILSGILQEQAAQVIDAYTGLGLNLVEKRGKEEWIGLKFVR